ncbi:HD family phosphohydrolase [Bdellovibrio sp. HCB337]|uniref:HD family phosphohydrolase n=1 Tax=Bdellovibrio sp. HCB337 TaxID=3394358 RepID=UPI0039A6F80A
MQLHKFGPKKADAPHKRVNYEDHSLKFREWATHLGIEKTFFGRIFYSVFEELERRLYLKRIGTIFAFCLVLSYLIFFQLELPYDFRVGDVAKHDVISPFSFEMTDEVTTEEKRIKAEFTVPVVYDYDTSVFERVSMGVYRSFRTQRAYLREFAWPKSMKGREEALRDFFQHKPQFEKELGVGISDFMFEWLIENRFNPRVESALIRNLENWYEKKIAEAPDRFIPGSQSAVIARVVHKSNLGREFTLPKGEILDLQNPDHFDYDPNNRLVEKMTESDRANILYLSRSLVVPNLTLNKQEVASRKQTARDAVIPVNITIKKNQVIVPQGSVVQPFQMAMIRQVQAIQADRRGNLMTLSLATFLTLLIVVFASYLRRFTLNKVRVFPKDSMVMMLIILCVVLITKVYLFITDAAFATKFGHILTPKVFLYAAPVAAAPMMMGLLVASGEVVWLFTAFMAFCVGIMTDFSFNFMLVTMVGGIAAARGVFMCKTRNDIYFAGIRTGLVNALLVGFLLTVTKIEQEGTLNEVYYTVPAAFIGGIFSALLTMMIIPMLESIFNYTTDVKLLELSNLNHPLLKEMIVKAPGTYHHSMMVGSMVEAAAEEIDANPLLGKVMCYYHDIGKTEHANYFIENQKPGHNPHDQISPFMSKTLLIAHVKDGVELGMQHKLGKPIIDGIIQHHGTTLISYFFNKAVDLKKADDCEISEEDFRYPGPKPQFREAALCMLADSIEAAARSLDEPTPTRLQNIVRNVIQRKFQDGQLDECNLTLKDISKVENAFTRILLGIYHQRIDYPRSAGGGLGEKA